MGSNKHSSTNIYRFICGPLYVQVYILVLMKTNFLQIFKSWSIKQNINPQYKHKHDHYVNAHVIRVMINMIAKQRWEHKNNNPY